MKDNATLLRKISEIQLKGKSRVKTVGTLIMNPISIGIVMFLLKNQFGWGWIVSFIASLVVLAIIMLLGVNIGLGLPVQKKSIKLYNQMTESIEKQQAYRLIKE